MASNSNWLVLAVVAIVALSSLVLFFQSSNQGAAVKGTWEGLQVYHAAGIDFDRQVGWDIGLNLAANWRFEYNEDQHEYCSRNCGQRCAMDTSVRNAENCKDSCESVCERELLRIRGFTK